MNSLAQLYDARPRRLLKSERTLNTLIGGLQAFDSRRAAHWLLTLVRLQRRRQRAGIEKPPRHAPPRPQGPYKVDARHECALLIFVPRSLESRLVDDCTGGYGYSHVAIDMGEIDTPTGKHVMTEASIGEAVHRTFQYHYGARAYVRIPLGSMGVECGKLRACVNATIGERYDIEEALTWGAVNDPVRQICSGLVASCLPADVVEAVAAAHKARALHRHSVSIHHHGLKPSQVFISPNGFAQFFGAPHGSQVKRANQLVRAHYRRRKRPTLLPVIFVTALLSIGVAILVSHRIRMRTHDD